ncbi:Putative beta-barrel porin type 2 domain-containing protein [Desulfonema limicola]|uniref:Beta-barrel porin type 2 domain-containing protein n=1 Tax=Desulfonema limicola TaxID=45656 RepID=A0A975GFE3_9BACT|nr:outer membrane beta-barrel protein [Desulfonema limicola]QTA79095.1 Putative beta-barrel porin type 2 domain-containing protein [Desulfonema limicola]
MTINSEYTDNIFLSDNNKQNDIITTISPGINLEAKTRNNNIEFLYELGYSHYKILSNNNSLRHNSVLSSNLGISRHTKLQFNNTFKITEDPGLESINNQDIPQDDVSQEYSVEKETGRHSLESYLTNSSVFNFSHQLNRTDFIEIQYSYDILKNEDPEIRNREQHKPSFNLIYCPVPNRFETKWHMTYMLDDKSDAVNDPGYSEERINPLLDMKYWAIPRRLSLNAGMSYNKGVINYNTLNFDDNIYESLKSSLGMTYHFLPDQVRNLTINTNGYYEKAITYTGEGMSDTSDDFKTWYGLIKVNKKVNHRLDAFVQYGQTITDFMGDGRNNDDYIVYEPSIGIKYILAQEIPLSLSAGYLVRDIDHKELESAITINGKLGAWKFTRYGDISFKASSGYEEDHLGAERLGFGIYYDAGFNINYIFSRYISGKLAGFYKKNRYLDLEETRNDKTKEIRCSLIFKPAKWFLMGIDYSFRDINSTLEQDSYKENRIILKLKYSPYLKM